ncbi:MAG: hypothetical protein LBC90_06025 [Candidatus Adiutrix sp.]|nr:hypothetical protein [Candidatus Adiutrix sp.]
MVSDFSLIDAIEAGLVKVPRVPVADNAMVGEMPAYRDLWLRIKDDLPKKGRGAEAVTGEPHLPPALEGALLSLYGNYEKYDARWAETTADPEAQGAGSYGCTPPVFIVVCNNTNVSKLIFDYIAGWEKTIDGQPVVQAGRLAHFRNDDGRGGWLGRPNTILVDSRELESGQALSESFKKLAAREIDDFKREYRLRFPGRDIAKLTDEDLLREVLNTVGKPGKMGEGIKCVVSVSMLTEGWDANTVTHVLGVRAFGTQLLCEQVVGRGLRRVSYEVNDEGLFSPEYAEVYGVPFSFIPAAGGAVDPKPGPIPTRVRALEARRDLEMEFPRLAGYRYDLPAETLTADFSGEPPLTLSTRDLPTETENAPIVGQSVLLNLDDLKKIRLNEVAFRLARAVLERYFQDDLSTAGEIPLASRRPWLFPQLLAITKIWLDTRLVCRDDVFPQLLLLTGLAGQAVEKIYRGLAAAAGSDAALRPILRPYDQMGSTRYVDFDTARPVWPTRADKCHISHVVADTGSWEQKTAQALETLPEVKCYVKNHNLGFAIPYTWNGQAKQYFPDFLVHLDDGQGSPHPLKLILEVSGENRKDKAEKTAAARTLWVPAVNNHGAFGRWAFLEITDPWNTKNVIREFLKGLKPLRPH